MISWQTHQLDYDDGSKLPELDMTGIYRNLFNFLTVDVVQNTFCQKIRGIEKGQ